MSEENKENEENEENEESPRREHSSPLGPGTALGRFILLEHLGEGGMGIVYAAYDPNLERRVALKLLRPETGDRSRGQERLLREAQALARLSHPNVVPIHDVGIIAGRVFLVMEYVPGQDLLEWAQERERPWGETLDVYRQAGMGLAAAHEAGLVHRDFKPANVRIRPDGRPCVLDFGLARGRAPDSLDSPDSPDSPRRTPAPSRPPVSVSAYDPTLAPADRALPVSSQSPLDEVLTRTGALVGTPAYMAPEQYTGGALRPAADQFSFCVSLYEALYGQRPFAARTLGELHAAILGGDLCPPPAGSTVPPWLFPLLRQGLHVDPDRRYPSMTALLDAFTSDTHGDLHKTRAPATWLLGASVCLGTALAIGLFAGDSSSFGAAPVSASLVAMVFATFAVCSLGLVALRSTLLATEGSRKLSANIIMVGALLTCQRAAAWHLEMATSDYITMELFMLTGISAVVSILFVHRFWWCGLITGLSAVAMTLWPEHSLAITFVGYTGLNLSGIAVWLSERQSPSPEPTQD